MGRIAACRRAAAHAESDDLKRLHEVSKLKPEYPGWMLERQGGERTSNLS